VKVCEQSLHNSEVEARRNEEPGLTMHRLHIALVVSGCLQGPHDCRPNSDHPSSCGVDLDCTLRRDGKPLTMHFVFFNRTRTDRPKCIHPNMQCNPRDLNTSLRDSIQHLLCEVKSRCRSRCRPSWPGIHRLVALFIRQGCVDIRRQRC